MKKTLGAIASRSRGPINNSKCEKCKEVSFQEFKILSDISLIASYPYDFDYKVESILKKTASQTDLSRILVFENNDTATETSVTHEWCREGISQQSVYLQNLSYDSFPSLKRILESDGKIISKNIRMLPRDLTDFFEPGKVSSVALFQLWVKNRFFGMIIFEECTGEKVWSSCEIELFGRVTGIIANGYECMLNEKVLRSEMDKAEESNKAKTRFIAKMSHEIRTPLNAILGMSEALYYKVEAENHKKMVKSVLSSGKLLLSLLNDVLDLSKIDAGKIEIIPQEVDTVAFLDEIEVLYHDIAARKNLTLIVERSISLPAILFLDDKRVKQVLFNLVSNAILFTRWGQIRVSADFNSHEGMGGQFIIRVSDTGPGIPEEKLISVFDEYSQFEDTAYYEEGSTGLGLSISKKLIERMGGCIEVKSTVGKGSVFTVTLPAEPVIANHLNEEIPDEGFTDIEFMESSILIVDDVLSGIELLENHLSGTIIKVFSALNGETALEILRINKIDLIILDLYMPYISGDELGNIIRLRPELKNIPLVAYTAASADMEKLKKLNLFDDHLFKPVSRKNLFTVLTRYLKHEIKNAESINR
jgi:signal transduction histidine kinase